MKKAESHKAAENGSRAAHIVLTAAVIYTLLPLALLFINAFKPQSHILQNPIALPQPFTLAYIRDAARAISFAASAGTTLMLTAVSIGLIVLTSSLCAWMMVRAKVRAAKILFYAFTAAMLIPFQSLMYPLLSLFDRLGLKNLPGLVIMYGGFGLSMSVFLYHGFLGSIPLEIEEAAVIDGAGPGRLFFQVIFPLLSGTTATVVMLNAVWIWNDYLLPFLVIGNRAGRRTLTLELYFARLTAGQYGNPWELIFPAVAVSILPIVAVFVFLQRWIVSGITAGAVKG
ncbi:MAG: carbohydrate ABC transporter permease [Ruminococcaceae bacterium]|nr:carbohydrate ABC transporter permease [Oscillospiraceae bacterium]